MKETDLFLPVKTFLLSIGCSEVFGEVNDFDVLGLSGVCNIGVELKTRLSFKLLDQALDRKNYVEYLFLAIPKRQTRIPRSVRWLLEKNNIGLLMVDRKTVSIEIPARFNRFSMTLRKKHGYNIRNKIHSYHKSEIGGVKSGEGKTQYSVMIEGIRRFLRTRNKATIEEILNHCETHYAQPKPSLAATLMADWNRDWCDVFIEDGERYFRIKNEGMIQDYTQ